MRRRTREEYDKLVAAGMFAPGERVGLVEGEILRTELRRSRREEPVAVCQTMPTLFYVKSLWRRWPTSRPAAAG